MAAKDLQIVRTQPMQVSDAGSPVSSDRSPEGNPAALLIDAVRRHWLLLAIIVAVAGSGAFFIARQLKKEYVTASMVLKPQQLPLTDTSLYKVPDPSDVASLVKSPDVIGNVAEAEGLNVEEQFELMRSLHVRGDSRARTLVITLAREDRKEVVGLLETVGKKVVERVKSLRTAVMKGLAEKVRQEEMQLKEEVKTARIELAKAQQAAGGLGSDTLLLGRMQDHTAQRIQLESNLEAAKRRKKRILRDSQRITTRVTDTFFSGIRRLIAERQQQVEVLGQGLKETSRPASHRRTLLAELDELKRLVDELDELEKIVHERIADDTLASDNAAAAEDSQAPAGEAEEDVTAVAAAGPEAKSEDVPVDESDDARHLRGVTELCEKAVEEFRRWSSDIVAVGQGSVGDFDQQSHSFLALVESDLRGLWEQATVLAIEMSDIEADVADYETSLAELGSSDDPLKPVGNDDDASIGVITRVMKAEARLNEVEGSLHSAKGQLARIEALKDLDEVADYYVSSDASFDPKEDVKSNFMKLFVFSFAGIGFLLVLPIAFFEWRQMRPTPVSVISKRWNLPSLGIQAPGRAARLPASAIPDSASSLRLMALRIQQSLFQPHGKVVLFSSFDHQDSPLTLIRALAKCFSMREESVLIVQTMPCDLERQAEEAAGQNRKRRMGVAEYLAGECDDLDELVKGTGVVGIDFLPGGCAATASEAMASSRLTSLIDHFRDRYSMILLNGPSTYFPADLQMLAARADGIVFTVNNQSLRGVYGEEVLSDLIELGAPILGFAESMPGGKHAVPQKSATGNSEPSPAASLVS